jgi:hypothetical protein
MRQQILGWAAIDFLMARCGTATIRTEIPARRGRGGFGIGSDQAHLSLRQRTFRARNCLAARRGGGWAGGLSESEWIHVSH